MAHFRFFVSAVSGEFRAQRAAIAAELRKGGLEVREQQDFRKEPDFETPLSKLHHYILECHTVIALVGEKSGEPPAADEAAPFAHFLPPGVEQASYTQWEIYFAHRYGKPLRLFLSAACTAETPALADPLQSRYLHWLKHERGLEWEPFEYPAILGKLREDYIERQDWQPLAVWKRLPTPIADHIANQQLYSLWRLSGSEDRIQSVAEAHRRFVERKVAFHSLPGEPAFSLTERVLHMVSGLAQGKPFEELVMVGSPGEGKTTAVQSLLCELSEPVRVDLWRVVPMLADCVTLSRLFQDRDDSQDSEKLNQWLALAIAPEVYRQARPKAPPTGEAARTKVGDFVAAMKAGGFRLLLIIEGFDELDPAASSTGVNLVNRVLDGLYRWLARQGIHNCLRLATTRDHFEGIERLTGMRRVDLQPPDEGDVVRLARAAGVGEAALDHFCRTFRDPVTLDSKLVYFRPLVRYFQADPAEAMAMGAGRISPLRLMKMEVDYTIDKLAPLVTPQSVTGTGAEAQLKGRLRSLLLMVALESLKVDPREGGRLDLQQLREVVGRADLPGFDPQIDGDLVFGRLLHVLIYACRGDGKEVLYRLPHNEYRDYLLADALFTLIQGEQPAWPFDNPALAAEIACAYRRSARVKDFLRELVPPPPDRYEFVQKLVALMNQRLPNEGPTERSDCSPHAAMLTLLLSAEDIPEYPVLRTAGINFHGAVARSYGNTRVKLPGNGDWTGAILREADLRGADLSHGDFTGANLDNAKLNGADLTGARFPDANLRNVAMGAFVDDKLKIDLPTILTGAQFDRADLFNYRFQGLKGYCCFWDLEPALSHCVLVAGSGGLILLFDLAAPDWGPLYLQTQHQDDILDLSRHPQEDLIVTTSRDGSVHLYKLPPGSPADWPKKPNAHGIEVCPLEEAGRAADLFPRESYPRRAQFGKSGRWLGVIARDFRVAFLNVDPAVAAGGGFREPVYGLSHTGPVMCLIADPESARTGRDRFYTAGYDGRIVLWSEPWKDPPVVTKLATEAGREHEIVRALVAHSAGSGKLWVGTETDRRVRLYGLEGKRLVEAEAHRADFPSGVFSLAIDPQRRLLAAGLASGDVLVFPPRPDTLFDWNGPHWLCRTGDEIVRALQFVDGGKALLAATWDGGLHLFNLEGAPGEIGAARTFLYPPEQWRPREDFPNLEIDGALDLSDCRGVSARMKEYLRRVGEARAKGGHGGN